MTLPSSPPLLPQSSFMELPSSPPLLPTTSSSSLQWIPTTRKRQLSEYDSNVSSDPLFSDDTSGNEDATEYQRPKRKRMVKGPWYSLASKSARKNTENTLTPKQKDYSRNMDSGIWMGSDASEESIESISLNQGHLGHLHVNEQSRFTQTPRAAPQQPTPLDTAAKIVTGCVENGKQTVDLSGLGLTHLPDSTLKPLQELIRQPLFDASLPPSDDELGPLTPDLQLFLASNGLTTLPDELFQLENITVLSLRNNALTELPSSIVQLRRLKELSLAGNNVKYLPWELLDVLQAHQCRLIVRPNPLIEPLKDFAESTLSPLALELWSKQDAKVKPNSNVRDWTEDIRTQCAADSTLNMRTELELRLRLGHALREEWLLQATADLNEVKCGDELIYLASSTVQFYDIDGHPTRSVLAKRDAVVTSTGPGEQASSTRVPSLLELSLQTIKRHYDLSQIPDAMPSRVQTVLHMAQNAARRQLCSTCQRGYIIPRAQWIEYWHSGSSTKPELTHESVLPFVRRVCSWACATTTEIGTFRS